MRLTLSTLRCPDTVPPETRSAGGGEFSLGRAPDNSWVLADPDRHLSKRHCILAFRNGGWQIADTSTNGTYLNREASPIGQGQIRDIQDGDRIRLGAYEIEVRIEEAAMPAGGMGGGIGGGIAAAPSGSPFGRANPFDDDVFAPQPPPRPAFGEAPQPSAFGNDSPLLPADFDPLGPADADPFRGPSIADHSPSVSDAFRPPPVAHAPPPPATGASLLPDDWDLDEPLIPPAAKPAAPAASPVQQPAFAPPPPPPPPAQAFAPPPPPAQAFEPPAHPAQAFAPPPPPPAQAFEPPPPPPPAQAFAPPPAEGFAPQPAQVYAPPPAAPPQPVHAPQPATMPPPEAPFAAATPSPFAEPEPPRQAVPPAPPVAAAPAPVPAPAADGALLAAFLRGAGMPNARMDNSTATMEELGRAFRSIVSGLRAVLIARASIKGEFRIEQTMIRAKGNNPLKFSADDDDALSAILGTGRRTNMGPAEAIAEALRDITLHELATIAAMQAATREVLKWLSPEEAMAAAGSALLPMQRKAKAFDAFEDTHRALIAALSDDFERVFGKAFAQAYEQALHDAAAKKEVP